jgi:hypothetical protein
MFLLVFGKTNLQLLDLFKPLLDLAIAFELAQGSTPLRGTTLSRQEIKQVARWGGLFYQSASFRPR